MARRVDARGAADDGSTIPWRRNRRGADLEGNCTPPPLPGLLFSCSALGCDSGGWSRRDLRPRHHCAVSGHDRTRHRRVVAPAIRADRPLSFPVCPADLGVVAAARHHGERLCDDRTPDLAADDPILGDSVRHQLCHGCGYRHHDGVSVRYELGLLLALRRRHFRCAARHRRVDGVFSRSKLRRSVLLWLGPTAKAWAFDRHLARRARRQFLGSVDPDRQWLDAEPGRRPLQLLDNADGARVVLRSGVQPGGSGEVRPHRQRRLRHRLDVRARGQRLLSCCAAATSRSPNAR